MTKSEVGIIIAVGAVYIKKGARILEIIDRMQEFRIHHAGPVLTT